MRENIKTDRLSFKAGTFEWINFFGLPFGIIILGLMFLYFFIVDRLSIESISNLIAFVVLIITGVTTYLIQLGKLKFKTFELKRDIEDFKKDVREILIKNKWEIEYDNSSFLQAVCRASVFSLDLITLKFHKGLIKWNVIHHPDSHNSIAALFSPNRFGKKLIKQIIACA